MRAARPPGRYFEEWTVGDQYETASITITDAHIWKYAYMTGYYHPMHMDPEYARKTIFGERIAPGFLVYSISTGQSNQTRLFEGTTLAFLGVKYLNFLRPVKPGDTIKTIGKLLSKRPSSKGGRGIVVFYEKIVNQDGETVTESENAVMLKSTGDL